MLKRIANRAVSRKRRLLSDRETVEREHAAWAEQSREMAAQLQFQAEEIVARESRGASIKRLLKKLDQLRDRYWSVETRRRRLHALLPKRSPTADDF